MLSLTYFGIYWWKWILLSWLKMEILTLDISGQNSWWRLCTSSLWTVFPPSYIRRLRAWSLAWIVARDYIHINVLFAFFLTICPQTNACNFTKPLGAHNASFPANLVSSVIFLLFSIFLNKKLGRGKQLRYEEFTKSGLTHLLKLKRGKSRVLMSLPPSAVSVSSLGRNVVSNWKPLPSYNSKSSSSFNVWETTSSS